MAANKRPKIHFETVEELLGAPVMKDGTEVIKIRDVYPFKDHPFKVIDNERMDELVDSIKANGVLSPVLVRPRAEGGYEMISGHRRLHASQKAGLDSIPAIIKDMSDDEAIIAMVDSNVQREEILPSERAWSLKMKMDAMRRQGARLDLEDTYRTECDKPGKKTAEIVGDSFGLKARQVQKYPEVYKLNFKEFDFQTSRSPDIKLQEVYETNPNNNYINNKYISDNDNSKSNLIVSVDGRCDQMRYEDVIANNIDLDILIARNPHEKELLNGIYDLILETVLCANETVVIASNRYPTSFVRGKFLKLKSDHIEYVMECFKGNTTKVKNIKKYLLAALFNAPTTISGYYTAEVNHDLCQPVTR